MILLSIISTSTICVWATYLYIKCQNLSQKICFTAAKHSGVKNGRFRALERRRQMKNRAAEGENLHIGPAFVHVFCSDFAAFCVSVSTPNFQKSTPNFQKALTFENRGTPFFLRNKPKQLIFNDLENLLNIRVFSPKRSFAQNFQNMRAKIATFVKIFQRKLCSHTRVQQELEWVLIFKDRIV